jgi:Zn2+/Cd2+-exporting ATPase
VAGHLVRIGNQALLGSLAPAVGAQLEALEEAGKTVMIVERAGRLLGLIAVADEVRPEAREALAALRRLGIEKMVMLTGDNERVARAVAARVGVDEVRAGLLPAEKVRAVEALRAERGSVAMVGDGVNDAPALAAATVGIAMGAAGTDQALEVADVALMADDLSKLAVAIDLGRAARGTIRNNVVFSLGIKLVFLLLALPGLATLWMAVFADEGASLLVTANGLRLARRRS